MADLGKVVVNLSSVTLNSVEQCFLSKGLNFVPTRRDPPILDVICSVEHSLSKVDPTKAAEIKGATSSSLAKRCSKELLITKADKGNVVVLLNQHDYLAKINALLDTDIYRPLKLDPPTRHTALSLVRWDSSRD
uniref:Uncharacterized protein n=1 Tax=Trichuris muris TaxID=70415 RepID=A0A5S6R4D8_TRIMR